MRVHRSILALTAGLLLGGPDDGGGLPARSSKGEAHLPESPPWAPSEESPPFAPPGQEALTSRCRLVKGSFDLAIGGVRLTWRGLEIVGSGTTEGTLRGPTEIAVRRTKRTEDVSWLQVRLRIKSDAGAARLEGSVAAKVQPAQREVRSLEGTLILKEGTGGFKGLRGEVLALGTVDTDGKVLVASYLGELCPSEAGWHRSEGIR
jgi:hypothetical protein